MDIRLGRLLQLFPLDLPIGRAAGGFPFVGIDPAIAAAVEQRHSSRIAFPALQQFRDFAPGVGRFS